MINKQDKKLLLIAWFDEQGLSTIRDSIFYLVENSAFDIDVLNIMKTSGAIPMTFNYYKYDGLIIHPTASYNPDTLKSLDLLRFKKISNYPGIKVMMKQDEHYRLNDIVRYLREHDFSLLLTITPPENSRLFYPESELPNLEFMQYLTGYVSDRVKNLGIRFAPERPIDVGYRGSLQPLSFGRLAYEKQEIGATFEKLAKPYGLVTDISSKWEDRFMGDDWFAFLSRCKGLLGVESGASIIDFDGSVEETCNNLKKTRRDISSEEILAVFKPLEDNLPYKAISPRHFEAAACRCVQILYEGEYQGIFKAGRHYIPLKRDWSNFNEVIEQLRDPALRKHMTDAAYEEIIMNPEYSYEAFVKKLDARLKDLFSKERGRLTHSASTSYPHLPNASLILRRITPRPIKEFIKRLLKR